MEIAPVPHRSSRSEWRRLALGVMVLVPVVLLVLLPAVLGLDRYVVTDRSMDGSLGRGSVVLAREVPPSDLRVGDVITYQAPGGGSEDRLTRRIVAIQGEVATTQADTTGSADPRTLPLTSTSYARVWLAIPWIGYPFVVDGGGLLLSLIAVVAFVLALVSGRRQPQTTVRPVRPQQPVGSR